MTDLRAHSRELLTVLQTVEHLFGIEAAIFDGSAALAVCSRKYLEKKGSAVHKPSVLEVLEKDAVSVIRPGEMPSCAGCRFSGHCPATVELLKRIMLNDRPVGVLAFSSFSEEGQTRIMRDMEYFKRILDDFSGLISLLLEAALPNRNLFRFERYLSVLAAQMQDGIVAVDRSGDILGMNQTAQSTFNGLCQKSVGEFLPDEITEAILSGEQLDDRILPLNDGLSCSVTATPVQDEDGVFDGAVIRFAPRPGELSGLAIPTVETMWGSGTHMSTIRRQMQKIVNSPSSVFISGETGTGKSLLAKSIHYQSARADKPFVTISCANIPESLFESELFGYEAGAFTGALKSGKHGKLEMAGEGTLFLDEISEIPMSMQAKLLCVLQDRRFERVGGTTSIPLHARIISASNADIRKRIAENRFRADLFYRLNVISLEMLPLCRRMEDLDELLGALVGRMNQRLGTHVLGFSDEVRQMFFRCRWPGNIRQLENVVEYCVNMADGEVVQASDLPAYFLEELRQTPDCSLKGAEAERVRELLDRFGWDAGGKKRAAAELGISVRTLYRKLEQRAR